MSHYKQNKKKTRTEESITCMHAEYIYTYIITN